MFLTLLRYLLQTEILTISLEFETIGMLLVQRRSYSSLKDEVRISESIFGLPYYPLSVILHEPQANTCLFKMAFDVSLGPFPRARTQPQSATLHNKKMKMRKIK